MAVDPNGGVYVAPVSLPGDTSISVVKLNSSGTGVAWKAPVGFILSVGWLPVDSRPGYGIHWPLIDEDLAIGPLLRSAV